MIELLLSAFLFTQGVSTGTVTGRLLGVDGTPAAGVRVAAMSVLDANNPTGGGAVIVSIAQTDALGRYRLENVRPGRYFITAGLVDFPTYYPGVAGTAGATAVTVTSGSEIAGVDFAISRVTVLKVSGRVIREDVEVQSAAQRVTLSGPNLPPRDAVIAADGSFQFSNVRPGSYSISLTPAYGSLPRTVVVDEKDVEFDFKVGNMAIATGSVDVEGGGLRPQFTLSFQGTGSNPVSVRRVVSEGTFRISMPLGDYRLMPGPLPTGYTYKSITLGATDLLEHPLELSVTDSRQIVVTLGVSSPPPWVKVAGYVTDAHNRPAGGVKTINLVGGANGLVSETVNADGSFEFPMIMPGIYRAGISPSLVVGTPTTVTVGTTDVNDLRVAIPGTNNVAGRVVVEGGGPAPQLAFVVTNSAGGARIRVTASPQPDGTFTVTLAEGEMRISLNSAPTGYHLKSMTHGSTDLLVEPLRVEAAKAHEILVTLSPTSPSGEIGQRP